MVAFIQESCIIKRYCEKRFVHKYLATIGIDYGVTKVVIKDKDIKVNIFDMAGHPIFYEVRNEFYKDTQGAVLTYDVSNRNSFESLDAWLLEMQNEIGNQAESDNVVVCVCANKIDKKRVVDESEGRLWADIKAGYCQIALFESVVSAAENGGKKVPLQTQLGYSKDQIDAIQKLKSAKNDYERLGLQQGANKPSILKDSGGAWRQNTPQQMM
ncbi:hypothetical protein KUTeg_000535 [Tegillarca granosa]|uniref:Uncharacterized protein n=1 Tax=Tegillarca granosa TaxID=220873 RepID=A0ABQ9FXY1_TEGGR|nr:hypothetical protein KUTeg_000535 [Tegillarca granosa]